MTKQTSAASLCPGSLSLARSLARSFVQSLARSIARLFEPHRVPSGGGLCVQRRRLGQVRTPARDAQALFECGAEVGGGGGAAELRGAREGVRGRLCGGSGGAEKKKRRM